MQVGNVLQVVPSQKPVQGSPMAFNSANSFGTPVNTSPVPPAKTQKATAVVAPSSVVSTPSKMEFPFTSFFYCLLIQNKVIIIIIIMFQIPRRSLIL